MAGDLHYQTPEEDTVPLLQKIIYGIGAFVNNLLGAAIGGAVPLRISGLTKYPLRGCDNK